MKPIIFSSERVRAILDNRRTQMRNVVEPRCKNIYNCYPAHTWWVGKHPNGGYWAVNIPDGPNDYIIQDTINLNRQGFKCPYGKPGDLLYVKETWKYWDWTEDGMPWLKYKADDSIKFFDSVIPENWADRLDDIWEELSRLSNYNIDNAARDHKWRSSIFMPKWASRIILKITDIRVEKLQDISAMDCISEGIERSNKEIQRFKELWDSINGKKYPWLMNPWVFVRSFKQAQPGEG